MLSVLEQGVEAEKESYSRRRREIEGEGLSERESEALDHIRRKVSVCCVIDFHNSLPLFVSWLLLRPCARSAPQMSHVPIGRPRAKARLIFFPPSLH